MKNWLYFAGGLFIGILLGQVFDIPELDNISSENQSSENSNESLEDLTYEELYKRAQVLDVAGRSKMNKEELIHALQAFLT